MKNWPDFTKEIAGHMRTLRGGAPDVMKAFGGLAQAALAPKALDTKTKELLALGIAVAIRCDDCIGFHVKAALAAGRYARGNHGDARHGDLHGRRPRGNVREPRHRRLRAVRKTPATAPVTSAA